MTREIIHFYLHNILKYIFVIFIIMSWNLFSARSQIQSKKIVINKNNPCLCLFNTIINITDVFYVPLTVIDRMRVSKIQSLDNDKIFYLKIPNDKNLLQVTDMLRRELLCLSTTKSLEEVKQFKIAVHCLRDVGIISVSPFFVSNATDSPVIANFKCCLKPYSKDNRWITCLCTTFQGIITQRCHNIRCHRTKRSYRTKTNSKINSNWLLENENRNPINSSSLLSLNLKLSPHVNNVLQSRRYSKYENTLYPILYKKNNSYLDDKPVLLSGKHAYSADAEVIHINNAKSIYKDNLRDDTFNSIQEIHITKRSNLTIDPIMFPSCPEMTCRSYEPQNSSFKHFHQRKFCRCDNLCTLFDDCCKDAKMDPLTSTSNINEFQLSSLASEKITCTKLPQPIHEQASFSAAFMVTRCMDNSPPSLVKKCSGNKGTLGSYSYLWDIPVISNNTGIMYKNMFCAACYKDFTLKALKGFMSCNSKPEDSMTHFIKKVRYIPGSLSWQSDKNLCFLQMNYGDIDIRWCERKVIQNCTSTWMKDGPSQKNEIAQKCSSITAYVKSHKILFKNSFCAMCNNENPNYLQCFEGKKTDFLFEYNIPIEGLFQSSDLCKGNYFWDPVYEICIPNIEDILNGSAKVAGIKSPYQEENNKLTCRTTLRKNTYSILYPNGTIYLRKSRLYFHSGEYEIMDNKWIKICVPTDYWTTPMKILSILLLTLSMICLALHMIIFLLLPKRRNIPSMNLFSLSFALFISELIYACFFNYQKLTILCQVAALLLYYFLSSAFIWMNVMSIDICRTFRSSTYKIKSKKVFVQYSLYAWILPVFPTTIVIAVDNFASKDFILIPDLASETCWFNNIWGHAFFFTIPAGLIVLINMVFYGFSVWGIYNQRKLGKLAAASVKQNERRKQIKTPSIRSTSTDTYSPTNKTITSTSSSDFEKAIPEGGSVPPTPLSSSPISATKVSSTHYTREKNNSISLKGKIFRETENFFQDKIRDNIQRKMKINKKNRIRLILYSKLALIMGMTWIFAFLSIHTNSIILEYLFIIFNGCQGTVIFFSFDCKKVIWNDLKEKFGWKASKDIEVSLNEVSKTYPEQYTHTDRYS